LQIIIIRWDDRIAFDISDRLKALLVILVVPWLKFSRNISRRMNRDLIIAGDELEVKRSDDFSVRDRRK